jgi:S-methylmethionine-dependent homocysteine/selenocysteine methylase
MPAVLSFTVETDGRLPTGQTLKDAIIETDARTGAAAAYYMLNCAHPTHFEMCWTTMSRGCGGCAACAPTPRPAATRSSTPQPTSMPAIR